MKNVYEQMEEQNARENVAAFLQKQALPYEAKKTAAKQRVLEYYHEMCDVRNANVHVSVGGLDSITLPPRCAGDIREHSRGQIGAGGT